MEKILVIVESPAKAKTINKYLGEKYIVKSSIGHIRDLLTQSGKNKNNIRKKKTFIDKIGIDPYQDWKAKYYILPGKEKIISELKSIAKKVNYIYLATDFDREGEAIAWHLKEVLGENISKFRRIVFNEITKNSIQKAFKNVSHINMHQVHAQQTRRFMDRIVGYMISPLLWTKISRGLSAGRVQSVAVRIIVEREHEIKNFISQEYWVLRVFLSSQNKEKFTMHVTHYQKKKFFPINKNDINDAIKKLNKSSFIVVNHDKKIIFQKPPAPFITSTLQQAASSFLNFTVKKTMLIAQKLYERGYITYIRTDSVYLCSSIIKEAQIFISHFYGSNYLPKELNVYFNKKYSQESHEAIRPSDVTIRNIHNNSIDSDSKKLYHLIWNQFIASQMISAEYNLITLIVIAKEFKLKSSKKIMIFKGWKIVSINEKDDYQTVNDLEIGSILFLENIISYQKFTKSAPRFSESSLVKELEKKGIGRPSTYASIASTIQDRGYVKIKNNKFYAEKIGELLIIRLKKNFSNLLSYNFTAHMEKKLDKIATNKMEWKNVLNAFFKNFYKQLESAKKIPEEGGMELNKAIETSIDCPICLKKMGIKIAMTGMFLSCSGYNTIPKKRCTHTISLFSYNYDDIKKTDLKQNFSKNIHRCKTCNMLMDIFFIDDCLKLYICGNHPTCSSYILEKGQFNNFSYLSKSIICEKCHSIMILKIGRFGKFFLCTNNNCTRTRSILKNGEISKPKLDPIFLPQLLCKKSNAYFVLREGIAGIFFAASTFPQSRETRSPLVEELLQFKHLLPKKIHYLTDAPIVDNDNNKTVICFNKNNKTQYIASKKKGRFTGWFAFFINKKWCICIKK